MDRLLLILEVFMCYTDNFNKIDPIRAIGRIKYKLEDGQMEEIDRLGNFLGWPTPEELCETLPLDFESDTVQYYNYARNDLLDIKN